MLAEFGGGLEFAILMKNGINAAGLKIGDCSIGHGRKPRFGSCFVVRR
jgi:hypothetical protein